MINQGFVLVLVALVCCGSVEATYNDSCLLPLLNDTTTSSNLASLLYSLQNLQATSLPSGQRLIETLGLWPFLQCVPQVSSACPNIDSVQTLTIYDADNAAALAYQNITALSNQALLDNYLPDSFENCEYVESTLAPYSSCISSILSEANIDEDDPPYPFSWSELTFVSSSILQSSCPSLTNTIASGLRNLLSYEQLASIFLSVQNELDIDTFDQTVSTYNISYLYAPSGCQVPNDIICVGLAATNAVNCATLTYNVWGLEGLSPTITQELYANANTNDDDYPCHDMYNNTCYAWFFNQKLEIVQDLNLVQNCRSIFYVPPSPTSPTSPAALPASTPTPTTIYLAQSQGLTAGGIAGIVIAVVAFVGVFVAWWLVISWHRGHLVLPQRYSRQVDRDSKSNPMITSTSLENLAPESKA